MGLCQRWRDERGFTVLELMIVVSTISALLGISGPTFTGAQARARDRIAQADLRTAYVEAEVTYYDRYDFSTANAAGLSQMDPAIPFADGGPAVTATPDRIFVSVASGPQWLGVKYSKSSTYFGLAAIAGAAVTRCKTKDIAAAQAWTAATCTNGW
jgi:type II secretory pathway pseudopilin PulG